MNVDPILFKPIKKIELLIFDYYSEGFPSIEEVIFTTDDGISLVIKSEPNFDEIIVEVIDNYKIKSSDDHTIVLVDTESDKLLSKCINKSIMWIWFMTNNQNYNDGVEIELQSSKDIITFRFIVEASSIGIDLIERYSKENLW